MSAGTGKLSEARLPCWVAPGVGDEHGRILHYTAGRRVGPLQRAQSPARNSSSENPYRKPAWPQAGDAAADLDAWICTRQINPTTKKSYTCTQHPAVVQMLLRSKGA